MAIFTNDNDGSFKNDVFASALIGALTKRVVSQEILIDGESSTNLDATQNWNGASIDCASYNTFLLQICIYANGSVNAADECSLNIQWKTDSSAVWTTWMDNSFNQITFSGADLPIERAYSGTCYGENMRVQLKTDYTASSAPATIFFKASGNITLKGKG